MQTTTLNKMENNGVDPYGIAITAIFYIAGIFTNFQGVVVVLVGATTIVYNGFRIWDEYLRTGKYKALFSIFKRKIKPPQ
jgi:hypothetical protein